MERVHNKKVLNKWKEIPGARGYYRLTGDALTEILFRADTEAQILETLQKLQAILLAEREMRVVRKKNRTQSKQSIENRSVETGYCEEDLFKGLSSIPILGPAGGASLQKRMNDEKKKNTDGSQSAGAA